MWSGLNTGVFRSTLITGGLDTSSQMSAYILTHKWCQETTHMPQILFWHVNLALPNIGILFLLFCHVHETLSWYVKCSWAWREEIRAANTCTRTFVQTQYLILFWLFWTLSVISCRGSSSESTLTSQDTLLGPTLKPVSSFNRTKTKSRKMNRCKNTRTAKWDWVCRAAGCF